jgi:hypothetical protein
VIERKQVFWLLDGAQYRLASSGSLRILSMAKYRNYAQQALPLRRFSLRNKEK